MKRYVRTGESGNSKYWDNLYNKNIPADLVTLTLKQDPGVITPGWKHIYIYDHSKNFLFKKLISSSHTENVAIDRNENVSIHIYGKNQDDPEPSDVNTEIILLGISSSDIVLSGTSPYNFSMINSVFT